MISVAFNNIRTITIVYLLYFEILVEAASTQSSALLNMHIYFDIGNSEKC